MSLWAENPSGAKNRTAVAFLAFVGLAISTYLGLYQLGVLSAVWDPVFGAGSTRVLHSIPSLPVPDALLGAAAYFSEILLVVPGNEERHATRPTLVLLYALVAFGLAITGLALTCYGALAVHSWCFLCLCSAAISLFLAWPAFREARASKGVARSNYVKNPASRD